jgi:hypothetical protein
LENMVHELIVPHIPVHAGRVPVPVGPRPVVDHEDADHRIDRAGILPRPKRLVLIWLGGFSEAAYDRAARIGDGFLFSGRTQTDAVQIKARIEVRLRELGRDVDASGFRRPQHRHHGYHAPLSALRRHQANHYPAQGVPTPRRQL